MFESVSTWRQPMPVSTCAQRRELIAEVAATIDALSPGRVRVGVDGRSAAGKTTFGHELAAALRELGRSTACACLDDFKHPWAHARQHGYDRTSGAGYYRNAHDAGSARELLLEPAGAQGSGTVALCAHDPLTGVDHRETVVDLPEDTVVIVDGVFAFRGEHDSWWDYRIHLRVDAQLSLARGIARDSAMEGREEATRLHRDRYGVAESIYLAEVDPAARADAVIDNSDHACPYLVERHLPEVAARSDDVRLQVLDPHDQRAQAVLRAAMADVASRYYGRAATGAEVEAALAEESGDDLVLPDGLLIVATDADGATLGCAGLALLPALLGEVRKVYVAPTARGRGLGQRLVAEVERLATVHGRARVRLDTRTDLVEARRLYARLGYAEVEAFNTGPYAEHWFAKDLPPLRDQPDHEEQPPR